jgi:hypothetical protein
MPTVLRWRGYRFFFYSGDVGEPPHVHVRKDKREAKVYLVDLTVATNIGYAPHELALIVRKVAEHRQEFERAWHDHFGP